MQVEVLFESGSGNRAEIESDIEALCLDHLAKQALCMGRQMPEIECLLVGQILHAGGPAVGNHHQMA